VTDELPGLIPAQPLADADDADEVAGWRTAVGCPLCGDESVRRDVATMCDPLLLMVCESSREDFMEHLRTVHPQEFEREHAKEQEMNAALASIFGVRKRP